MPSSNTPPVADPEMVEEGLVKADMRGRPATPLPMKTILRRIPSVADQAAEGRAVDLPLAGEMLALIAAITLEKGLRDTDIPLSTRVDWALRSPALFIKLADGFAPKKKNNYPATKAGVQEEVAARMAKIKELSEKLSRSSPQAIEAVLVEATDEGNIADGR